MKTNSCFVALKVAISENGVIDDLDQPTPLKITGQEADQQCQYLRSLYDGIMVGRKTIQRDDPRLNIRHGNIKKDLKVFVLDPHDEIKNNAGKYRISQIHKKENLFFVNPGNPKKFCEEIYKNLGVCSLFVEGGAQTHSFFFNSSQFQKFYVFKSNKKIEAKKPVLWDMYFEKKPDLNKAEKQLFGTDELLTILN